MGESVSTGTVTGTATGSAEHLPECAPRISNWGEDCICQYLHACEKRVLDMAWEAVAAVEEDPDAEVDYDRDYAADPTGNTRNPRVWLRSTLSAIDALKGKS